MATLLHTDLMYPTIALQGDPHYLFAVQAIAMSFILGMINLIPLPPLDGSRIVAVLLPEPLRNIYYRLTIPTLILLAVVFIGAYQLYPDKMLRVNMKIILEIHEWILTVRDWIQA